MMNDLIAAELTKLRTTRTAWVLLLATAVMTGLAVTGAVIAADSGANLDLESAKGVRTVLHVSGSGGVFRLLKFLVGVCVTTCRLLLTCSFVMRMSKVLQTKFELSSSSLIRLKH